MRKTFFLLIVTLSLYSSDYFAKANPINEYHIRAAVSGEITKVNLSTEGKISDGEVVIRIDDELDKFDLESSKAKLDLTNKEIKLLEELVQNAQRATSISRDNYNRVKNLQSYTKVQKDAKLTLYLNSKNSLIQAKSNLQKQKIAKRDLKLHIKSMEDRIEKKNIKVKSGDLIYKIYPNVGDFVGMGAKLLDSYDLSHAKLTIFISEDDLEGIEKKTIYLDGKKTNYKIDKLWRVADSKNISSYKAEIIIDKPKIFSKLIKVEFK